MVALTTRTEAARALLTRTEEHADAIRNLRNAEQAMVRATTELKKIEAVYHRIALSNVKEN